MKQQPRFQVYKAADGWRWRLKAANGRVLATGEAHTRKADAERAVDTVTSAVLQLVATSIEAAAPAAGS